MHMSETQVQESQSKKLQTAINTVVVSSKRFHSVCIF